MTEEYVWCYFLDNITNLWLHVIEHTEHASLVRTWWYVTKIICPLDFVVPESVRELKSDLKEDFFKIILKRLQRAGHRKTTCSEDTQIFYLSIFDLLYDAGSQAVDRFQFPFRKWRVELDHVLLK